MADTVPARAHPGAILGIARFYHDPRGSMRAMLESRPGEARLFAYAMLAVLFVLAANLIGVMASERQTDVVARATEQIVSVMFFVPIFYYGLAALGTLIARAFGGVGGWYEGRAAFFWASLVSGPIVLLTDIAAVAAGGEGWVSATLKQVGAAFSAWALAPCFAEAFGFASVAKVLAVIVAIALGIFAIVAALGSI